MHAAIGSWTVTLHVALCHLSVPLLSFSVWLRPVISSVMMLYIICNVSTVRCRSSWDTLLSMGIDRVRSGRSMSTTYSTTHSIVLRRCLKFAFWSNGGSECYAWLRWRPFISRNCRHCTTLASSSNIPYCIVLLTDIWTMFSVLIIIIAIIVFVLHYFWYYIYMFITDTSSLIVPLVLTQGILNIFKNNSRTFWVF